MSYASTLLARSVPPSIYWTFDDAGTANNDPVADSSGNGQDGYYWVAGGGNSIEHPTGLIDAGTSSKGALVGGGYASRALIDTIADISASSAFTIEAWVNVEQFDGSTNIGIASHSYISLSDAGGGAVGLAGYVDGVSAFAPDPLDSYLVTGQTAYLVLVFDGVNARMYLDSVLIAGPTAVAAGTPFTWNGESVSVNLEGVTVDEWAFTTAAISVAEITSAYEARITPVPEPSVTAEGLTTMAQSTQLPSLDNSVRIPIDRESNTEAHFDLEVTLDGVGYLLELRWNVRSESWHLNVWSSDEQVLYFSGLRLVADFPLAYAFADRTPPGFFCVVDSATPVGSGEDPTLESLGDRHQLYYVGTADFGN